MNKSLFTVLLGVLLLSGLIPLVENGLTGSPQSPNEDDSESKISDTQDNVAMIAENMFDNILNNSRTGFLQVLKDLSRYIPINVEYSVTVAKHCNVMKYNRSFYFKIPLIIAAVLMVLGAIFGFFGYRFIQLVLYLIGFLVGFTTTYFVIVALTHGRSEFWILYVALGAAILVGLLAGLITICVYPIGIFLAGASIGFLIVWFILGAINVSFFRDHVYVPIIIAVVAAIIVGILALILQKWFFIVGTSILGAFVITWGLDYYVELGSMIYYLLLFAENRSSLKLCWYSWIMLPVFAILAIAGFLIQALLTGRKYDHKKEMRGICCGLCRKKKRKDKKDVESKSSPHGGPKYEKLETAEK